MMKISLTLVLAGLVFGSIGTSRAEAQEGFRPLRVEAQGIYRLGPAAGAEFAFPTGAGSSLGLGLGASYGVRDAWNIVSAGANFYPFSELATGPFVSIEGAYGFDVPAVQGDSGTDWRASLLVGYRVIAFGLLTGSVAAGVNYDIVQNGPSGAVAGFNPAVVLSLGFAK